MAYSFERFMTLEQIRGLVTADFEAVDKVVKQRLHSQVALVDQVALGAFEVGTLVLMEATLKYQPDNFAVLTLLRRRVKHRLSCGVSRAPHGP
jgi:hypothetical protein